MSSAQNQRLLGLVGAIALLAGSRAGAGIFTGSQIEIAWTGTQPFGTVVNDGSGPAEQTYTAPMNTFFSTATYDNETSITAMVGDSTLSVQDANSGLPEAQWIEFIDVNDTLPDFTTLNFTAITTYPNYSPALDLEISRHAVAIRAPLLSNTGLGVVLEVTMVPEPSVLGMIAVGLPFLCRRRLAQARAGRQ